MEIHTTKETNRLDIEIVADGICFGICADSYTAQDGTIHINSDSINTIGFEDSTFAKEEIIQELEKNHNVKVHRK